MHAIFIFVLILCKFHTNHSGKTCVSMEMTQSNRSPHHYCKYNQKLPRLDQASPNSKCPQGRQEDSNKEEIISKFTFHLHTSEYKSNSDHQLFPSLDIVGCSTNHCCRNRTSNSETSDYSMMPCLILVY